MNGTAAVREAALLDPMSYDSRPSANASHGNGRIDPMIPAVAQARFTIIAAARDEGAPGPESRTDPRKIA